MITIYREMVQGTQEWLDARLGLLTASVMKQIITPGTRKAANNDKSRGLAHELLAQRITRYVEPQFVGDDMLRGVDEEVLARQAYSLKYAEVTQVGFVTNDKWGFTLGYSPDGLVGNDGLIEAKSRRAKYQFATILEDEMPEDYVIQVQTGLLVSERKWCDFLSYCGGTPMLLKRIYPDAALQSAILDAATSFEVNVRSMQMRYEAQLIALADRLTPTERIVLQEITL